MYHQLKIFTFIGSYLEEFGLIWDSSLLFNVSVNLTLFEKLMKHFLVSTSFLSVQFCWWMRKYLEYILVNSDTYMCRVLCMHVGELQGSRMHHKTYWLCYNWTLEKNCPAAAWGFSSGNEEQKQKQTKKNVAFFLPVSFLYTFSISLNCRNNSTKIYTRKKVKLHGKSIFTNQILFPEVVYFLANLFSFYRVIHDYKIFIRDYLQE